MHVIVGIFGYKEIPLIKVTVQWQKIGLNIFSINTTFLFFAKYHSSYFLSTIFIRKYQV